MKQLAVIGFVAVAGLFVWLLLQSGSLFEGEVASEARGAASSSSPGAQRSGQRTGGRGGRPAPLVVVQPVSDATVNDRLQSLGNGLAIASVSVVPLSNGLLREVLVKSGQLVRAGDVLAQLEDDQEIIARDRAQRTLADAANDSARLEKLYRSRTTSEVELSRARALLATAELDVREAALALSRRAITAPVSGIVGLMSVDPGNYVTTQTELLTIDDRSALVIEFWIPEKFANQIALGQRIQAIALSAPGKPYEAIVSAVGSRIEADSRTLQVQARLDNSDDTLRPGMSFQLTLGFPGQHLPAVDPLAIQWDSTGSFVWQLSDKKVKRVPIRVIQRNPEAVVVQGDLMVGDSVVTEGLLSLRPGASVRVANSPRLDADNPDAKPDAKPAERPAAAADTAASGSSNGS